MLNAKAEKWLEDRGINPAVADEMQLYNGKKELDGSIVADERGNILCFPYIKNEHVIAETYIGRARTDGSQVRWHSGPGGNHMTFYNADILGDPALSDGTQPLVIVGNELDCLAIKSCGWPFVVSIPGGMTPSESIAPDNPEGDARFLYIFNNLDKLKQIKRFVLFTEGDDGGMRLRDELAMRLGRARCSFVTYPNLSSESRDASAVLKELGQAAIVEMISNAAPFPIKGIYHLHDFPEVKRPKMVSTGWRRLDLPTPQGMAGVMVAPGFFMTVLGIPNSGKSIWTLQLVFNLAYQQGWPIGIASFEVQPVPFVRDILRTHYLGIPCRDWRQADKAQADAFIDERFTFFHIDAREDDSEQSLEWLIARAEEAVIRDGIKVLLVDPWNELEHVRRRDETETQYTARAIRALKKFAMAFDVLVCVVIHPTKGGATKGGELSLYDADGSAHWINKADIGIVIERDETDRCLVHGKKFRFSDLGRRGTADFIFDPATETYSQ